VPSPDKDRRAQKRRIQRHNARLRDQAEGKVYSFTFHLEAWKYELIREYLDGRSIVAETEHDWDEIARELQREKLDELFEKIGTIRTGAIDREPIPAMLGGDEALEKPDKRVNTETVLGRDGVEADPTKFVRE
jgi:hypothetical protein